MTVRYTRLPAQRRMMFDKRFDRVSLCPKLLIEPVSYGPLTGPVDDMLLFLDGRLDRKRSATKKLQNRWRGVQGKCMLINRSSAFRTIPPFRSK